MIEPTHHQRLMDAEAPKLTRADLNILRYLAKRPNAWALATLIPDGNGRGSASGVRLRRLREDGFIRYGKQSTHSLYGYQITQRGLLYV